VQIADLMTHSVISVHPDTPVADVARTMLDHQVSGVPVVDATGALVGIVTEGDLVVQNANVHFPTFLQILDARIYLTNTHHFEEELRRALGTVASDVMTREVQTVDPADDISVAATLMVDKGINPIPVIGQGRLVGIISRRDIIRHILAQDTDEGPV
jgi:CBS domain-containing protein